MNTSKEPAQNGHAEAASVDGFLIRAAARLRALCACDLRATRYTPFVMALLDRVTKIAARDSLNAYIGIPVIPGFLRMVHTENPGAAFSFLSESNPILRGFVLIGVSTVVLFFVARVLWKHNPTFAAPLVRVGLAMVLGGAAGNLYDRVLRGTVTDFIEVYHGDWTFPVFNVADSAITVGAALLIFDMLILHREAPQPAHK